jgi:hypothetical protein
MRNPAIDKNTIMQQRIDNCAIKVEKSTEIASIAISSRYLSANIQIKQLGEL